MNSQGTIEEKYWARVLPTGFCWEWTGYRDAKEVSVYTEDLDDAVRAAAPAIVEWAQREALTALGELRAAYGDTEARLVAAEAVIADAVESMRNVHCGQDDHDDALSTLLSYPSAVLADHDKEVAARTLRAVLDTVESLGYVIDSDVTGFPSGQALDRGEVMLAIRAHRSGSEGETR